MTNEEAIEILQSGAGIWPMTGRANNALNMAIKALEQEPCVTMRDLSEEELKHFSEEMKRIRPQVVEQEPKTGHWEWVQYDYNPKLGNWHCSECRCIVVECVDKEEKGGIPLYKYCPQCGAKMVEPQESEKNTSSERRNHE